MAAFRFNHASFASTSFIGWRMTSTASANKRLLDGAKKGDLEGIRKALAEEGADVNACDEEKTTALHWAATNGSQEVCELLLAHERINPDAQDIYQRSPLHIAAGIGNLGIMQALLAHPRCNPELPSHDGGTALHLAARRGQHEAIEVLLTRTPPANIHARNDAGYTPLHNACSEGWQEATRVLVEFGANLHLPASNGGTSWQIASAFLRAEIIPPALAVWQYRRIRRIAAKPRGPSL